MARLIGPDESCRVVYLTSGSDAGKAKAQGMSAPIYADEALTTLADILSTTDGAVAGSQLTVDAYSKIPLFKYPDGVDTVYTSINGGPAMPLYARIDDRIDSLATRLTELEPGGGAEAATAAALTAEIGARQDADAALTADVVAAQAAADAAQDAADAAQATADAALATAADRSLSNLTSTADARANLVLAPAAPTFGSVIDTALAGTAKPVTSSLGVLVLDRCVRAYVTVETQTGGVWSAVTLTNTTTGATNTAANGPGSFTFSAAGATQVRATGVASQASNSSWSGRLWMGRADVTRRTRYSPSPATPATSQIMNLGRFGFVPHPTLTDVVYGYAGNTVVKSVNGGAAYSTLFTAPTAIQRVQRPSNGRLLAFCDNGIVYRADANDANFASVHTAETPGAANSSSFGYDEYGDIIVYAEYGPNNAADQARRCYMSEDGGATWRKIFEGPQNNGTTILTWHTHDVRYDPYEDLVWVVNGDGPTNANIHFRKRSTSGFTGWTKMWADGETPLQFTTIIPLPSCVLFLSDNFHQSIWRYDRRTRGITNVTPSVELANTVEAYRSPEPISTNPFVDRSGSVHAAYFGWIVNTANSKIVHLYGTADGLTFHQLWTSPRAPLNEGQADTFYGVFGASAPDNQGRLLIDYRDRVLGQSPGNLIKMARPSWVAAP